MTPPTILERLSSQAILPVITLDDPTVAVPLATVLVDAGLPIIEITLRTSAGREAIALISEHVSEAAIGAGTVTSASLANAAVDAGAQFLVSPGLSEAVISTAAERQVVAIPGVATPTEVMRALDRGISTVKLFPAAAIGGTTLLSALSAVWSEVRFVPTGGISAANAGDYLAVPSVVAVGGSWMVPGSAVAAGDWGTIAARATEAAQLGADRRGAGRR